MKLLPDGLHTNVPFYEYLTSELGMVSKSALDRVARSPAHYYAWVTGAVEEPDTAAMAMGRAFHCALLEPDTFASTFATEPAFGDCRLKANKEARDAWREAHAGKTPLSADDAEAIRGMVKAVHAHPLAAKMVRGGKPELTLRWTDKATGLPCKGRDDYYVERLRMVVDVKTTEDASPEGFRRSIAKYGYHRQAALYSEGHAALGKPLDHFVFVAVEKTAPYAVAAYTLDVSALERGAASVRRDIDTLAECMRLGRWPGYPEDIVELALAPWAA